MIHRLFGTTNSSWSGAKEFLAYLRTDKAATVFESVGFTAL